MKALHMKFHEWTSSEKGADISGHKDNQLDGRTDITKLIGASGDGANTLKIEKKRLHVECVT